MNSDQFNKVFNDQLKRVENVLGQKAGEYADDSDRLHNFKVAAALRGCTPIQAAAGMMAKHTVSVYDMAESGELFTASVWDEKITDHINYLILMRALAEEEEHKYSEETPITNPYS